MADPYVRIALYLVVVALFPLSVYAAFWLLDWIKHDELVEQFAGRGQSDALRLDSLYRDAPDARECSYCGMANGAEFDYCHNCQERLT